MIPQTDYSSGGPCRRIEAPSIRPQVTQRQVQCLAAPRLVPRGTHAALARNVASRPRIIVATPHAAESADIARWLNAGGFECVRISVAERVLDEIRDRGFDAALIDRAFACVPGQPIISAIRARNQKTPIFVVGEADGAAQAQVQSRGAIYLARPLDEVSFVCMVSMAVMETRPERRSDRKRVNQLDAIVEGVTSRIVDVSNEGLRLEVPRTRKSAPPPPVFSVRVPILGLTLLARRMWTATLRDTSRDAILYGSELANNSHRVVVAWRGLVDTLPAAGMAMEIR